MTRYAVPLRAATAALALALAWSAAIVPATAVPLMELRADVLMPMADDFKKALKLNANQLTLWQQTESRTRQLLRERQSRRERLQASAGAALAGANVELRELAPAIDAEAAATAAEEQRLRAWWLAVNDALDETQRQQVAVFLGEQLQRVSDGDGAPRHREDGDGNRGARPKGGGPGGMGGGAPGGRGG